MDYDACRIADSLSGILAGKNALQLEIREYHFRGEHHRSGHLESLSRHVVRDVQYFHLFIMSLKLQEYHS